MEVNPWKIAWDTKHRRPSKSEVIQQALDEYIDSRADYVKRVSKYGSMLKFVAHGIFKVGDTKVRIAYQSVLEAQKTTFGAKPSSTP